MKRASSALMNELTGKKDKDKYFKPTMNKKISKKMKCTHPGCKKTFEGFPNARFCEIHKLANSRKVDEIKKESIVFSIEHDFTEKITIERNCDLCGRLYRIDIIPGAKTYPAYCDEHRNEYKRQFYQEYIDGKKKV